MEAKEKVAEQRRRTRRVLLLVLRDEVRDQAPELMAEIEEIYTSREDISRLLNDTLAKLEEITHHTFPRIAVDLQEHPSGGNENFHKILKRLANRGEFRLIASISPSVTNNDEDPPSLQELEISHLVTASFSGRPLGWRADSGIGSANVVVPPSRLVYLIVDLMLDIAMFYRWQSRRKGQPLSLEDKIVFSRLKASYAARHRLGSYYGPILDDSLEYFCLASNIRHGESFSEDDCRKYEALWNDFLDTEVRSLLSHQGKGMKNEVSLSLAADGPIHRADSIVDALLKQRKLGGQLSERDLRKKISVLKSGEYCLVVAVRKPHRARQRQRILYLLARTKWRSNMWAVVPADSYYHLIGERPFLEFISFRIS